MIFRNRILRKGIESASIDEIKQYFQSVCLMVEIKGQTRDMIRHDIETLLANFAHGTINLFIDNSNAYKSDKDLQDWFKQEYSWLKNERKVDILLRILILG